MNAGGGCCRSLGVDRFSRPWLRTRWHRPQIELFVIDSPPQALDEEIVVPRGLAIHAYLDLAGGTYLDEAGLGKLADAEVLVGANRRSGFD